MGPASVDLAGFASAGRLLLTMVADQGSAAHPYVRSDALLRGIEANPNLADAVHYLCTVHGRYPAAIDHAASQVAEPEPYAWMKQACEAFAAERAFLARLAAAAGPPPATPGPADSDIVVMAQCHALEMLTRSERKGCAIGAAMALVLDWAVIRSVLQMAAARFAVQAPRFALADGAEAGELADRLAVSPGLQRAMLFGAEQVSVQHRGLWDLLEARQEARAAVFA